MDSGVRVEARYGNVREQVLACGEWFAGTVDGHEGHLLHGTAVAELVAWLERFSDRFRFMCRPPGEARVRRLTDRNDLRSHPGRFVTCNDNPDRHLRRPPADAADAPSLPRSRTPTCNNATL